MKRIILCLMSIALWAQSAHAQVTASDLMGAGMPAEQAAIVAGVFTGGAVVANNVYIKARNAANSANLSLLKADASDNVVLNAGTGKTLGLAINSTNIAAISATGIAIVGSGTLSLQEATAGTKCMGTVTANGTTAVPVATTCALTASRIFLSPTSDPSGSTAAYCWATNIVNATSFDVDCDQANDGTLNWIIINESA